MRVGVLGGRFDPVHIGHLLIAQDAMEKLRLDRLLFVLAARPPHKPCVLPYAERRALLRRALHDYRGFVLSEIEARRPGPSYTIETLAQLKHDSPQDRFFLLVGADQFAELSAWREPERLGDYAQVIVMTRPGARALLGVPRDPSWRRKGIVPARRLPVRQIEVSSSEIRKRLDRQLGIAGLVPDSVAKLIRRRRSYTRQRKETRCGIVSPKLRAGGLRRRKGK